MKQYKEEKLAPILSTNEFLIMLLLEMIPIIQIIMPILWICGNYNANKKNLAKAWLVWALLSILISLLTIFTFRETLTSFLKMAFDL